MARYIDLEELERRIKKHVKPEIPEEKAFVEWCKDECIRQAYAMPTADVVPRSTINEIFTLIWDAFQSTYYDSEFEEEFDKIEKKYTEGDDNG